jgi:hypothetical protein
MDNQKLCLKLAYAEDEEEVINVLDKSGYWNEPSSWRYFGDNENNFATVGNQQSRPEAALVEKIINSVDAVLMAQCLKTGISPTSDQAPQSINQALHKYFNIYNGRLSNLDATTRGKLAENIALVATGRKTKPCYSIIDKGEGQYPKSMPVTLLSIAEKSNKLRIPFVQGKFNMGGTGVLQFCGENNFQLIVSKRHPDIWKYEKKEKTNLWGFTIVRRVNPEKGIRSSSYKYLAPNKQILSFDADSLPLLPGKYPEAYEKHLMWGTYIKLFEYQMIGLKTNILFDLYNKFSLLMPTIALPVRFYERRKGYSGHSFETTLSGLTVRLLDDKRENLEEGFPTSSTISVKSQKMTISIIAFKRGKSLKYSDNEGVIFSINGQTHGSFSKSFFTRNAVKMGYLADSLLVLVDCSEFDGRTREDLFMNSRDRLRSGELRSNIESELEDLIRNHSGLKELREQRRREDIENKLEDSKPLADIIEQIMRKSPTLSKLFIEGVRIPNPFKVKKAQSSNTFKGKQFPTYFRLIKNFPLHNPKKAPINVRLRVQYATDVENEYFDRDCNPGVFSLFLDDNEYTNFSLNLWNGTASLNISIPDGSIVGDILHFRSIITDINHVDPLEEGFIVEISDKIINTPTIPGERKPPAAKQNGNDVENSSSLSLPNIREVREDEWDRFNFTADSALTVKDSGEEGYDFFINMDNIHLRSEQKSESLKDSRLLGARYKYGMTLIGLAMLKDDKSNEKDDENNSIFEKITCVTKAISPILLPMIAGLGELENEEELEFEENHE